MSDSLDQVADDFWEVTASHEPTYFRHLLGDYSQVGSYEEASRAADARYADAMRDLADRAEASTRARSTSGRSSRAVGARLPGRRVGRLAATHLGDLRADPIHGLQVTCAGDGPARPCPTRPSPSRCRPSSTPSASTSDELADRVREGAVDGWVPAEFAVTRDHRRSSRPRSPRRLSDDPVLAAVKLPDGVDADALRAAPARRRRALGPPGLRGLPRRAARRRCPRPGPRSAAGCRGSTAARTPYAATLRYFTTTDKTAQEIHEIGLAQVAKLADEYRALGPEVVGTDDLQQIFEAMRTDPKLHFEHADELVEQLAVALARAEAAMGDWFEVRAPGPVRGRGHRGRGQGVLLPAGHRRLARRHVLRQHRRRRRRGAASSSSRWPSTRACPGHHLQLAIAAELPASVPKFRKHLHNSAYAEGWGLYTERLADEMGLYSSAVDRMGMYSADSMRACRLVVDTGLHALGWSRQQAVDYMVANSPLTEGVCRPEVDRYICSPGQATSYMIGRLEIQRMRRRGRAAAGRPLRRQAVPLRRARQRRRCRSASSTAWWRRGCRSQPLSGPGRR